MLVACVGFVCILSSITLLNQHLARSAKFYSFLFSLYKSQLYAVMCDFCLYATFLGDAV